MWLALVKALDNVDIMTDCNYTTAFDTLLKPQGIIENCSILWGHLFRMQTMPKILPQWQDRLISDARTQALKFNKSEIIEVKK